MSRFGTKKGFGLMIVLIMLGVVSMVAASVALRTQASLQTNQQQSIELAAEDAAYSGLQIGVALVENTGDTWAGTGGMQTLPNRPELGYQVFVNSNFSNNVPINDPDGTEIPPKAIYLKSVGYFHSQPRAGMTAIVSQDEGVTFNYPAFATDSLNITNSIVDAVDVSNIAVPDGAPIRTNGDAAGAITLDSSYVNGDVTVGPLGDPAVALVTTGGAGFSGSANVAGANLPLPSVTASYNDSAPVNTGGVAPIPLPPPIAAMLGFLPVRFSAPPAGTYQAVRVDDATFGPAGGFFPIQINILLLEDGDYYVSEFTTNDQMAIVVPGPNTRLHVRDTVATNASATTVSAVTGGTGLQVYQTSPGGGVTLNDTNASMIVTSQGPMSVNTSAVKGALYGTDVSLMDSQLTYRTELDGVALSANVAGTWSLFGIRQMSPAEVAAY